MAVSISTITKSAGWERSDVINAIEEAYNFAQFHGDTQSGIVTFVTAFNGGTYTNNSDWYFDVEATTTSGIGTGASFDIKRNSGSIDQIYVNRPGYGYTDGEYLTIDPSLIGGNTAVGLGITVSVHNVSNPQVYNFNVSASDSSNYTLSGSDRNGSINGTDPQLEFEEGDTINFAVSASGHPFYLKTTAGTGTGNQIVGVSGNGTQSGTVSWTPGLGDAGTYYYQCQNHASMVGTIIINSSTRTPISYGSTTTFYSKNVGVGTQYPFGVLRHEIESGKKYGTTYRGIQITSDYQLLFTVGNGFHPYSPRYNSNNYQNNSYNSNFGGSGFQYRYAGKFYYDASSDSTVYSIATRSRTSWFNINDSDGNSPSNPGYSAFAVNQTGNCSINYDSHGSNMRYATQNSPKDHDLKLRVYRSNIDPKFAIFSFSQPSVAGTSIDDNVFLTWFYHNYTSSLWDYDYVYNSALTLIRGQSCSNNNNGNYSRINLDTLTNGNFYSFYTQGNLNYQGSAGNLRTAHLGYTSSGGRDDGSPRNNFVDPYISTSSNYSSNVVDLGGNTSSYHISFDAGPNAIYSRKSNGLKSLGPNNTNAPTELDYNAVIKGIPVCSKMIPCPYYLPDDFVLIDFNYPTSNTDITQGDTITISGSEVYEIINASYNQYTETSGIALCARKV